jgi:hypothetical protein
LLVAVAWWIYALAWAPVPVTLTGSIVWTLIRLSCPVVLVGAYFHFGVSVFWSLLANAATYAGVGWVVEAIFRRVSLAHS